jgi:hypothetical protein
MDAVSAWVWALAAAAGSSMAAARAKISLVVMKVPESELRRSSHQLCVNAQVTFVDAVRQYTGPTTHTFALRKSPHSMQLREQPA